jgi:hypothetical protein
MPNYFNQYVDPGAAMNNSVNALLTAKQVEQTDKRNQLMESAGQREQEKWDIEKMMIPTKFEQVKQGHVAQMAKSMLGLPEDQRATKYADLINKVIPTPVATHPEIGPLGAGNPDTYLPVEEFNSLSDEQQKDYLRLLAYDSETFARLDLATQKGALEAQKIMDEHKNKRDEILFKSRQDRVTEGVKTKGKMEVERLKQEGRIDLEEKKAAEAGKTAASFTDEEIDLMGATYNLKGTLPSLGRGKEATAMRHKILQSAARQALAAGKDAGDIIGSQSDVKTITQSLGQQEKQYGAMGSFVSNLNAQVDRVKALAEEFKTFDTRLLNIPLRAVRGRLQGNPLQAKYDMYLTEIESEIGKLATGSAASVAELSIGAQEKWARIHDKNLSIKDMLSLLEETKEAGRLRLESVEKQMTKTRKRLRAIDDKVSSTSPMTADDYLKSIGK